MIVSGPKRGSETNSEVPVFSTNLGLWGAMTASGLSKLHVLPPNQTVRAKYYHANILPPFPSYGFVHVRYGDSGSVTELAIYVSLRPHTIAVLNCLERLSWPLLE
jgi:hypothetical protein